MQFFYYVVGMCLSKLIKDQYLLDVSYKKECITD